ncbi:MAG: hypothetical protein FD123_711 [Bacteroidetes bacterium]|nr:MAG: hypothetical protein FD123_711 [Bacteroidota bacterium]
MRTAILISLFFLFPLYSTRAQSPLLDQSFAGNGLLVYSADYYDEAAALLALPDTSVIFAFASDDSSIYSEDVIVDKLLPGGSPDLTFTVIYLLGQGRDSADQNRAFCIRAFRPDGSSCNWFGQSGETGFTFLSTSDLAYSIGLQQDGKLLVCGMTFVNNNLAQELPCLARLLPDGTPDSSFGGTGKIAIDFLLGITNARITPETPVHAYGGYFEDVTELPDGRILCGGAFNNGFYYEGALFMLNGNGTADSSFNGTGLMRFDFHPGEIQSIAQVLVSADSNWIALQNNAGSLPTDFDLITVTHINHTYAVDAFDLQNGFDHGHAMCLDSYGRLWVTGNSTAPVNFTPYYFSDEAFAYCLKPSGGTWIAENSFNGSGHFNFAFDSTQNRQNGGRTIAIDIAGRPVIAGSVYNPGNSVNSFDVALARLDSLAFVSGIAGDPVRLFTQIRQQALCSWMACRISFL